MKKTLFVLAALLGIGLLFSNCTKTVDNGGGSSNQQALTSLFTLKQSNWQANSGGGFKTVLNAKELTTDITDYGAVFIYISLDGGNNYEAVPSNDNNGYNFIATHGDGNVTLFAFNTDNATTAPNFQINVKVVSIPSALAQSNTNVDYTDYNAVKRAFHLN